MQLKHLGVKGHIDAAYPQKVQENVMCVRVCVHVKGGRVQMG